MNILITGATSGIGKQVAMDYASEGHTVIACGRNTDVLAELEQRFPDNIAAQRLDVSDADQTQQALAAYTDVDVVILSAGVCEYVDIENFEAAMFERVFEVNVFGMMRCVEALLPNMKAGSKLVLVGSTARLLPFTRAEAYGGSKAAIQYIARSLQVDLERKGIKVLTVSPGFVETPMTDANDFEMPMRVSVEFASDRIRQGIRKNKTDITFPTIFGMFLKLMSRLPQAWQVALSKRMS
ncbi:short-chain dehydrogenase [Pseudidiomarina tainanensis]|uniref:Short-chain dehydrogenase n=2 Tax=Pseudidiomarina TaxID=2800384 RepID=A0A1I6GAS8_9GAMM|nr:MULTISPECIES: SDR family NAD(P)-dependent oxidoreductase [Pseudidiomarina]RZQ56932.1 short-chain dehydrogenase [Pseudidiomarina tainanensis]SFR39316.1 Short-chain dehydrogenase [Pseudidiomarina maritima]